MEGVEAVETVEAVGADGGDGRDGRDGTHSEACTRAQQKLVALIMQPEG